MIKSSKRGLMGLLVLLFSIQASISAEMTALGTLGEIERGCAGDDLVAFWSAVNDLDPKVVEEAAQAGNLTAQTVRGLIHAEDPEWLREAAEAGFSPAQFHLGLLYLSDKKAKKREAGVEWLGKAADQGIVLARIFLGHSYRTPPTGKPDLSMAAKWYESAAQEGCVGVRNTLARMFGDSHDVPHDYVRAHMWFQLFVMQADGTERETAMLFMRDIKRRMTEEQVAEAGRLASEWASKYAPRTPN